MESISFSLNASKPNSKARDDHSDAPIPKLFDNDSDSDEGSSA